MFLDSAVEASEDQMETDDIDGSSSHATEKDDAEEVTPASEEVDGSSEKSAEKDDVSVCCFFKLSHNLTHP